MSQHLGHKHAQIKLYTWQLRVGNKDTRKSELEAETVSGRKGLRKKDERKHERRLGGEYKIGATVI